MNTLLILSIYKTHCALFVAISTLLIACTTTPDIQQIVEPQAITGNNKYSDRPATAVPSSNAEKRKTPELPGKQLWQSIKRLTDAIDGLASSVVGTAAESVEGVEKLFINQAQEQRSKLLKANERVEELR